MYVNVIEYYRKCGYNLQISRLLYAKAETIARKVDWPAMFAQSHWQVLILIIKFALEQATKA
jgi:hypothetical protein